MSQEMEHSVSQESGVAEPKTNAGGNITMVASEGATIKSTVVTDCKIENAYFGAQPDPPPDKGEFQTELKRKLGQKYKPVQDTKQGPAFSDIYTDLDITIETSDESSQIERIKCTDIFNPKHGKRTVLTKGISGTGKTMSVQKFILDWVEGNSNQDVDFVFAIRFQDFNKKKKKDRSMLSLLQEFFPNTHKSFLDPKNQYKTVIILDGLNEYESSFDLKSEVFYNVEYEAPVDVLLFNLFKGNLLDNVFLWITSQPMAASHLYDSFDMVTELKGFSDQQKEEYFKKIHNGHDEKAEEVISYLRTSRTLSVLCDIPRFCQILSMVLKNTENPFRSWTGLLGNFLSQHISQLKDKERQGKILLSLGKLAWELLKKDEKDFDESTLTDYGIEADDYVVVSGICTEVHTDRSQKTDLDDSDEPTRFRFFDPCIQEFLAAVYAILSFARDKRNPIKELTGNTKLMMGKPMLFDVLKSAVKSAFKKESLNVFVKFVLSLCEKSNRDLMKKLMGWIAKSQSTPLEWNEDSTDKVIDHISKTLEKVPPNQSAKLLEFLRELNDKFLQKKIEKYIHHNPPETLDQNMIMLLQTDEKIQQEFDMKKYKKSDTDVTKFLPVVKMSNRAKLNRCNLTRSSCDRLAQSLRNAHSHVKEMDLSENEIGDSGVDPISSMLQSGGCNIEHLSLVNCGLKSQSCDHLRQALQIEKSSVQELDLSNNQLGDKGLISLSLALAHSNCKLQRLRLACCQLTAEACEDLSSSLKSANTSLKHLDLSFNDLQDSGVQQLFAGVTKLETLRLASCNLTEVSGQYIGELLQSQTLKQLDLTNNNLKDSGLEQLLSKGLASADCTLEKLILTKCGITLKDESCCKVVSTAIKSEKCHLKVLDLSYNNLLDSGAKAVIVAVVDSKIERLSLACCALKDNTCELISTELKTENLATSCLQQIDLSDNDIGSAGATALSSVLKNPNCKWEKLCLSLCSIEVDGCTNLTNALKRNESSHLKHLDLRFNHPGEMDDSNFAPNGKTEISIEGGGEFRLRKGEDRYECTLTPDEDTAHQRLFLKGNKIRWGEWEIPAPQLLDRFDCLTQVLCKESLTGRCYWEVKWSGLVSIGVAYAGMARKGEGPDSTFGRNNRSWSLDCSDYKYSFWHDKKEIRVAQSPSGCHRVGVYLDWVDGTLAFFKIKTVSNQRKFSLLHVCKHNFSLPLLASFRIWCDSSVFICPQTSQKKAA